MEKLGVNPIYLITQIINFFILLVILKKIVYKPVLEALEKRRKKIEEGLVLTGKLTKEKEELEEKKAKILNEAQKEARAIIDKVREQAKKVEEDLIKEARLKAEEIIERGKKDVEIRRKEMEARLVKQTVDMAVSLTQKLIGEVLDKKQHEQLLKKKLSQFLNQKKLF